MLLVDDHAILLDGLAGLVNSMDGMEVVGTATNVADAITAFDQHAPDFVLTDFTLPDGNATSLIQELRQRQPDLKILVLSMHTELYVAKEVLKAGANGYMLKRAPQAELASALDSIANGEVYVSEEINRLLLADLHKPDPVALLTSREKEVLQLITKEYSNRQIAEALFIGERTVETHRKNLFRKTGAKSLVGLIKYAMANGLD